MNAIDSRDRTNSRRARSSDVSTIPSVMMSEPMMRNAHSEMAMGLTPDSWSGENRRSKWGGQQLRPEFDHRLRLDREPGKYHLGVVAQALLQQPVFACVLDGEHDGVDESHLESALPSSQHRVEHDEESRDLPLEEGVEDGGLIADVFVERGPGQSCPLGDDRVKPGAVAEFDQAFLGRIEDPFPEFAGGRCRRLRPHGPDCAVRVGWVQTEAANVNSSHR